jgi:FkbM family methyltransferase
MTFSTLADEVPATRLANLLAEEMTHCLRREQTSFDQAAEPFGDRLVLFGAGGFGRRTLAGLRKLGVEPLAFADNNAQLWGSRIEGVPVHSLSQAAKLYGANAAFLITIWNSRAHDRMRDRIAQLTAVGCHRVLPAGLLYWKSPEYFLPYFPLDLPHKVLPAGADVMAALHLFADEASRREYVGEVAFRLHLDYDALGWPDQVDHYFPADLIRLRSDEVFVDCGAFDGDTVTAFVEQEGESFAGLIAFEPDPLNWNKLQQKIRNFPESIQRKIHSYPNALGARRETVYFDAAGTEVSRAGQGSLPVECMTLDETLRDVNPTLIKFDIEGAEPAALEGARALVARCRPALAVSAYHEQDHLWKIPMKLRSMCEDYNFYLRPHGTEGWDLICYAIPSERVPH